MSNPRPHFAEVNLPFEPTLNYFAAPEAVLEVLTENELQGYPAVVAAYMNYETGVDLPGSKDDYPNLLRLIDMYFPVFFADIYDTTVRFSEGENGCRLEWSYFSSSREEHSTLFHRFENREIHVDKADRRRRIGARHAALLRCRHGRPRRLLVFRTLILFPALSAWV